MQHKRPEKLNTFTIGFHEKGFDESPFAKQVANHLGTNHSEYYCTQKDALKIIPKLCEIFDEPFGDSSSIPTTLVSQLARKNVTVSLSADGGDEIFAGYGKHDTAIKYYNFFSKIPKIVKPLLIGTMNAINPKYIPIFNKTFNYETRFEKIKYIIKANNISSIMKYTSQNFTDTEISKLINKTTPLLNTNFDTDTVVNNDLINTMLAVDYQTYLIDDVFCQS